MLECCQSCHADDREFVVFDDKEEHLPAVPDQFRSSLVDPEQSRSSVDVGAFEEEAWLRQLINFLWPYASAAVLQVLLDEVKSSVQKVLDKYHIGGEVTFTKSSLGSVPPQVNNIKVYRKDLQESDGVQVDASVRFSGPIDIQIAFGPNGMFTFGITHASFDGIACFVIKPLLHSMPVVGGVQVFCLADPAIDFVIEGILNRVANVPVLKAAIQKAVKKAFRDQMVLPNRKYIQIGEHLTVDLATLRMPPPEGVLRIRILMVKRLGLNRSQSSTNVKMIASAATSSLLGAILPPPGVPFCPSTVVKLGNMTHETGAMTQNAPEELQPSWSSNAVGELFVYNLRQMVRAKVYHQESAGMINASKKRLLGELRPYVTVRTLLSKMGTAENCSGGCWLELDTERAVERGLKTLGEHRPQVLLKAEYFQFNALEMPSNGRALHRKQTNRACRTDCTIPYGLDGLFGGEGAQHAMEATKHRVFEAKTKPILSQLRKHESPVGILLSIKIHHGFDATMDEKTARAFVGSRVRLSVEGDVFISGECTRLAESGPRQQEDVARELSTVSHDSAKPVLRADLSRYSVVDNLKVDQSLVSDLVAKRAESYGFDWHASFYRLMRAPLGAMLLIEVLREGAADNDRKPIATAPVAICEVVEALDKPFRTIVRLVDAERWDWPINMRLDVELHLRTAEARNNSHHLSSIGETSPLRKNGISPKRT